MKAWHGEPRVEVDGRLIVFERTIEIAHVLAGTDKTTRTYRDGMQVETIAVTSAQTVVGVRVVMHTGDDTAVNVPGKETVFRLLGTRGVIEFYGWEHGYLLNGEWVVPEEYPVTGHRRHLENMAAMNGWN